MAMKIERNWPKQNFKPIINARGGQTEFEKNPFYKQNKVFFGCL